MQKTDTRTWKTATFTITDGRFQNAMPGSHDFRIDCLGDGNEWIHMVRVSKQGGYVSPTPPPTATPTATPTSTPPVGPIQIQLYRGPNLVAYPGSTKSVTDALASIAGKYTKVYAAMYEWNSGQGKYELSWKQYIVGAPPFVNSLTEMDSYHGYWIYVNQDSTWTINP